MNADLILTNARVFTVDPRQPWAQAVAARDGRIIAVGSEADIATLVGPGTHQIDCGGRLVVPGLTDAHTHFLAYAERRRQVSLFGLTRYSDIVERLVGVVQNTPPGEWIQGWGWDSNQWDVQPSAAMLDQIAPNNPVVLARMDMHTWWVNSRVLEIAGVTASTPEPPESHVSRDENGHPTGLFSEWNAIGLIEPHIPEPAESTLHDWLLEAIAEANRLGLTGIHDQRIEMEGAQSLRLFQKLRRQGRLNLRVHANIAAGFLPEATKLGLKSGFGDDNLWLGHVKAFADGTMGSATAYMVEPYHGQPENYGILVTPTEEIWQLIMAASEAGFPISVHAIGDRAVREVLDVMAKWSTLRGEAAALPMPQRIEHVQIMHPDDLRRLAEHQIVASVQPVHLQTDWQTADRVWGGRSRYAYAFRTLLDLGTPLALGSDAPVAPLDPMLGIFAAVTRQDEQGQPAAGWYPEERLTIAEAIEGYTMGPARLSGKADRFGSITPGKYADLVVLSQDLFTVPAAAIPETKAWMTIFGGEVVFGP